MMRKLSSGGIRVLLSSPLALLCTSPLQMEPSDREVKMQEMRRMSEQKKDDDEEKKPSKEPEEPLSPTSPTSPTSPLSPTVNAARESQDRVQTPTLSAQGAGTESVLAFAMDPGFSKFS